MTVKNARTIQIIVVDEIVPLDENGNNTVAQHLFTLEGALIATIKQGNNNAQKKQPPSKAPKNEANG